MKTQGARVWMGRGLAVVLCFAGAMAVRAAEFTNVNNGTRYWSSNDTWTLGGVDADGIPDEDDAVTLKPDTWPAGLTLYVNVTNAAQTIRLNANDGNDCNLNLPQPVVIDALIWNRTAASYSWKLNTFYTTFTLRELREIGPLPGRFDASGGSSAMMVFTNNVTIEYNSNADRDYAMKLDFSGASSVHLVRSTNSSLLVSEAITQPVGNLNPMLRIGRADSGIQAWTVGAGSRPALKIGGSSQDAGIQKVGNGDVSMPDVDIVKVLWQAHPADDGSAISQSGQLGGGMYTGTVWANSLALLPAVGATAATSAKRFDVLGRLVLDGQGGLQAGGGGNGCAVYAVATNQDVELRLNFGGWSVYPGLVEVAPAGGKVLLDSVGAGKMKLNINNNSLNLKAYTNTPELVANTLQIGANAYITDRNWQQDIDGNAGGAIELRGDLVNASVLTNDFRAESTTLRFIPAGTQTVNWLETPSADLGLSGPGMNNFAFKRLILGQTSTNSSGFIRLALRDQFDNNQGSGAAEALYIENLALYAASALFLNDLNVYYKNSGSWQKAAPGAFAYGDGTGQILSYWPPRGAMILLR